MNAQMSALWFSIKHWMHVIYFQKYIYLQTLRFNFLKM